MTLLGWTYVPIPKAVIKVKVIADIAPQSTECHLPYGISVTRHPTQVNASR